MKSEENNKKFYGEKVWPIVRLIVNISLFIIFNFVWIDWNQSIASNLKRINISNIWLRFLRILLRIILFSIPILCFLSNHKSFIEIADTYINIYRPKNYPLFRNMESIKIWYEKIENIKIYYIPRFSFKHDVIIKKKSENWKKEKIRFFWLRNWKELASTLKIKWLNIEYI